MYNALSMIIGGIIAFMIYFNGILASSIGNYTSNVIIHSIGLILVLTILIIKRWKINFVKGIPSLLYTGGAIGICNVVFANIGINEIGATLTIALGLLGQVLSSLIIDHFGLLSVKQIKFNRKKIIGISLMLIGIVIMTLY